MKRTQKATEAKPQSARMIQPIDVGGAKIKWIKVRDNVNHSLDPVKVYFQMAATPSGGQEITLHAYFDLIDGTNNNGVVDPWLPKLTNELLSPSRAGLRLTLNENDVISFSFNDILTMAGDPVVVRPNPNAQDDRHFRVTALSP